MARSANIFLIGPMGAGKSTVGRSLADRLGLEFIDTDREIEKRTGADLAWIFDLEGEEGFRDREASVIGDVTQQKGVVVATGGGSILRDSNREYLSARGTVVYLSLSMSGQYDRTEHNRNRPLLQTDDRLATIKQLAEERTPLYESIADISYAMDTSSVQKAVTDILGLLDSQKSVGSEW